MIKNDFARPIDGYDGRYYITRDGDVLSLVSYMNNGKIRKLKMFRRVGGYIDVNLNLNKNIKYNRVHRLVAKAFIPNPNNYPIINHKDENPSNNNVDNLEWCTYKYNSNYGSAKVGRSKKVAQININGDVVKVWDSIYDATRAGYTRYLVSDCANGKIPLYKRFRWEFV